MQDLERGQRIKNARQAKRLTQPAVVQLLRERAGADVVTLRGYQSWESGGGIRWENAKILGDVLGLDPEVIMSDEVSMVPLGSMDTPTPFAAQDDLADRLDRIEAQLERIELMLLGKADSMLVSGDVLTGRLDRLERALTGAISESVTAETEEWKRLAQELVQGPSKGQTDSPPTPQRTAAARSKRAAKSRTP